MAGKSDLVNQVSDKVNMRKADVEKVLNQTLAEIKSSLDKGESVTLRGFGSFKVTERAGRKGRNPRTGQEITIPPGKRISFKYSK